MVYPDVDLSYWIKKFKLEIENYDCPKCGATFKTTKAVMTRESAGLITPLHGCGPQYWIAVLTPRTRESISFWDSIV